VAFANRTTGRAAALAGQFGAESLPLADVPAMLARHDIVVSCTASPLPIIGKGMVERALKARRHRPMVLVDLAVPRDVEPEVAGLGDVFLYTVDDLGRIVREGLESRSAAVDEAESIISGGVAEFMRWLESREMVPAIRALRDQAERMRRHEMDRALKSLARGDDPKAVLESLSQGLTNKLMHAPTQALHGAEAGERDRLQGLISRLFAVARDQ
jgi:glutamyl-tRNA reductase